MLLLFLFTFGEQNTLTMPDNVIFGAEFDPKTIVSGFTQITTEMRNAVEAQTKLQNSLSETEKSLLDVESKLKLAKAAYEGLDKTTANYTQTEQALKKQIDDLQKSNNLLSASIGQQKKDLDAANASAAATTQALNKVNEANKALQETSKKPIVPVFDTSKVQEGILSIQQLFGNITDNFDFTGLDELQRQIAGSKNEIEELAAVLDFAKQKIGQIDPNTEEFEKLNEIIKAGDTVLNAYNESLAAATTETEAKNENQTKSLRTQIKELKDELVRLEAAGMENTDVYRETELQAARLTDQYGDMQQRIRVLASDTKNLDFGLAAINTIATGFQAATGALELFGLSNDAAAEAQRKLLAIMNLVQGAQQLQNLLLKEGTLRTVGADIATKAFTATQKFLTSAFGVTATAAKGLSAALIATGVGALVVGIGYLISKLIDWTSATDDAEAAQKRLNKAIDEQADTLDNDIKALDFNNKIRLEKLKQAGLSEAAFYLQNKENRAKQIERYENELSALQIQLLYRTGAELEKTQEQYNKVSEKLGDLLLADTEAKEKEKTRIAEDGRKKRKEVNDKAAQDLKAANTLEEQIKLELSLRNKTAEEKELLLLKNKYDKDKAVLVKAHAETADLDKLYNGQRQDIIIKYNNLTADAERKLQTELQKISYDASEKKLALITDQFERETALVKAEAEKQKNELQDNQTALLNGLLSDKVNGIISPAEYQKGVEQITAIFDNLFDVLQAETATKLQDIGANAFQATIENLQKAFTPLFDNISLGANDAIIKVAQQYLAGAISFEDYQKQLTKIQQDETDKRLKTQLIELQGELKAIDVRRDAANISEKEQNALLEQRAGIIKQISDLEKQITQNQVTEHKAQSDENKAHLADIIQSYSTFAQTIVNFLQQISDAEQNRLNRQIAFQETRVENARLIAERGNAEYLELEQKRLDELERKRYAAAQRQIAINNALVLSEATLAAIGAISKAAQEGGIINIVAALAAVIGTIAAAYNFVNSIQPQSTEFFEGTEFVQQGRHKAGRDTIPARVNIGEAIIPTDTNKDYSPAVKAIYRRNIPANILNDFVDNYQTGNYIPAVDYARLGLATERSINGDMQETNKKLDETNGLLANVYNSLSNLDSTKIILDENGFSVSLIKAMHKQALLQKH